MSAKTLIVLGSGGHTAEILKLMSCMSEQQYRPRMWVVANTDRLGASKAAAFEERAGSATMDYDVQLIPRSRHVGQSFITSIWTTMYSFVFAFMLVWRFRPHLVLVNGPGTCIPICVAAALLRLVGLLAVKIVYVESIARVTRLSLSARILYYSRITDLLLVQWPDLQKRYPRSTYCGRLY